MVLCRCVPFLHSLAAITPNAHELLAIADAVQQEQGLPALPRPAGGVRESSSTSPQQLLAQLAPAAALVLQQGAGRHPSVLEECMQLPYRSLQQHINWYIRRKAISTLHFSHLCKTALAPADSWMVTACFRQSFSHAYDGPSHIGLVHVPDRIGYANVAII